MERDELLKELETMVAALKEPILEENKVLRDFYADITYAQVLQRLKEMVR